MLRLIKELTVEQKCFFLVLKCRHDSDEFSNEEAHPSGVCEYAVKEISGLLLFCLVVHGRGTQSAPTASPSQEARWKSFGKLLEAFHFLYFWEIFDLS